MQPWQASLLACLVGLLAGGFASYIGMRILQTRHDEKIRVLERDLEKAGKNIHNLRREVRNTLIRYLEDRIEGVNAHEIANRVRHRLRRPSEDEEDDEDGGGS